MTAPVRVMIVDDSAVVRRLLTQALQKHAEIDVVGTAANGLIALGKLPQLQPEALILDIEMPEMDGIATLVAVREKYPRLPVIMFSTLTERGAHVTLEALAAGASDYVLKPSTQTGETLAGVVANILVPKLLDLTRTGVGFPTLKRRSSRPFEHAPGSRLLNRPGLLSGHAAAKPAPSGTKPLAARGRELSAREAERPSTAQPATLLPTAHSRPPPQKPLPGADARWHAFGAEEPTARHRFASVPNTGLTSLSRSGAPRPLTPRGIPAEPPPRQLLASPGAGRLQGLHRPSLATLSMQSGDARTSARALGAAAPRKATVQLLVIAASTGGPNALGEVLPRLPAGLPVPIVVVQHMPPVFTRCLADRLSARSALTVVESQGGELLLPGHVYIAPGNQHLELVRDADGVRTLLSDASPENSCRPSADVLMRAAVRVYGGAVLAVVLTGMGQDGLRGAREIVEAGGRVLVQNGPTCVVWGMPRAVEEAGLAEAVVPLAEVAAAVLQRVGTGLLSPRLPEEGR